MIQLRVNLLLVITLAGVALGVGSNLDGLEAFRKLPEVVPNDELEKINLVEEFSRLEVINKELHSDLQEIKRPLLTRAIPASNGTIDSRPHDCAELFREGFKASGNYTIYPYSCGCGEGISVYCDMQTDDGGWTIILSRKKQTKQENFNRTWEEYKDGFGNLNGEHYIGNENFYRLTFSKRYVIRIQFTTTTGIQHYQVYGTILVKSEAYEYEMSHGPIIDRSRSVTSNYCLGYYTSYGRRFSTFDNDNDGYSSTNCASKLGAPWWIYGCSYYYMDDDPPTSAFSKGQMTLGCRYSEYNITSLQIMIRPATCEAPVKIIHSPNMGCCH